MLMLTASEYRWEATTCLELARQARELCVRAALVDLARDYSRAARQAERRERDLKTTFAVRGDFGQRVAHGTR